MNDLSTPPVPAAGGRQYRVEHITSYHYAMPVTLSLHLLHLQPRRCAGQQIDQLELLAEPQPSHSGERLDAFGNPVRTLAYETPHMALSVGLSMVVTRLPQPTIDLGLSPCWREVADLLRYQGDEIDDATLDALQYRFESPHVRLKRNFADYAADCFPHEQTLLGGCQALMNKIHRDFTFDPEATDIATPLVKVLEEKRGVCQDFAHLMLACLRSLGLAARYMSGYLLTHPPKGQPRLIGADATHAWLEVYCPHYGWVGFDPTNNCRPDLEHIVLGWGRDFTDVSPLRGVLLGGGSHDPEVAVTVMPLDEWQALQSTSAPPPAPDATAD